MFSAGGSRGLHVDAGKVSSLFPSGVGSGTGRCIGWTVASGVGLNRRERVAERGVCGGRPTDDLAGTDSEASWVGGAMFVGNGRSGEPP